jgi:hypothetical protein
MSITAAVTPASSPLLGLSPLITYRSAITTASHPRLRVATRWITHVCPGDGRDRQRIVLSASHRVAIVTVYATAAVQRERERLV